MCVSKFRDKLRGGSANQLTLIQKQTANLQNATICTVLLRITSVYNMGNKRYVECSRMVQRAISHFGDPDLSSLSLSLTTLSHPLDCNRLIHTHSLYERPVDPDKSTPTRWIVRVRM